MNRKTIEKYVGQYVRVWDRRTGGYRIGYLYRCDDDRFKGFPQIHFFKDKYLLMKRGKDGLEFNGKIFGPTNIGEIEPWEV